MKIDDVLYAVSCYDLFDCINSNYSLRSINCLANNRKIMRMVLNYLYLTIDSKIFLECNKDNEELKHLNSILKKFTINAMHKYNVLNEKIEKKYIGDFYVSK